jgi:hypothetical protein
MVSPWPGSGRASARHIPAHPKIGLRVRRTTKDCHSRACGKPVARSAKNAHRRWRCFFAIMKIGSRVRGNDNVLEREHEMGEAPTHPRQRLRHRQFRSRPQQSRAPQNRVMRQSAPWPRVGAASNLARHVTNGLLARGRSPLGGRITPGHGEVGGLNRSSPPRRNPCIHRLQSMDSDTFGKYAARLFNESGCR